jgi:hypothetical protein
MSKTSISSKNKYLLWVKSAGRCQYRGCNNPLHQDILTKKNFNKAYIAHIVGNVEGGPRGDKDRSPLLADDLSNLMLLCDTHHRLIDIHEVAEHPESLLLEMKQEHEERIERVTAISPDMHSHILTYKANVGVHTPSPTYATVSNYLLPDHYPAEPHAIDLSLSNSPLRDKNESFWAIEQENLKAQFEEQIRPKLRKGLIQHLSIFAFAPIPLLIKLGTLINDIQDAEIFQPVREPKTWKLNNEVVETVYQTIVPKNIETDLVAINLSLSATITTNRIHDVLGSDCSIYTITIDEPFNDFLKSKKQLQDFSVAIRKLFNRIKATHPKASVVHVFPAIPIATAIEFGRVWMPKADASLKIYDQNSATGGFGEAITIKNE